MAMSTVAVGRLPAAAVAGPAASRLVSTRPPEARPVEVDLAAAARLIGEPARAAMLNALVAGQALTAGELSRIARVSAATASEHLARLLAGGPTRGHVWTSPSGGHTLRARSARHCASGC